MNTIDITNPVTATIDSGCGFWGTEHFKADTNHIKLEMGEGDRKATLIENSEEGRKEGVEPGDGLHPKQIKVVSPITLGYNNSMNNTFTVSDYDTKTLGPVHNPSDKEKCWDHVNGCWMD